jgi:hypothetical protein
MTFWETIDYNKARKVLVIPNITNSGNIEKDSFVDVIHNQIKGLESEGEYFWNIILPQPVKKLNLINVKQHILQFSGDMIKMRTYPPDMNRLLETLEYDVIYSHLPDWPQVGRYKNDFNTKVIGYGHWWEMKSCNAEDRKNKWRWMPIELLGVSQMNTCFLNTQDQKNRVLEEAKLWFNDLFIQKLNDIFVVWNLGVDNSKIIETPQPKQNTIVFNHRAAAYKGYPAFIKLMEEYREKRQDFTVWVPQLDGTPEHSWIDNTKVPKHEYYNRLQQCLVGIQMRQTNYGWSVAATDCMMNGTPMIYQESDCYREIEPDGMFFKFKKDLFEMLDNLLDNEEFRKEKEVMAINRCSELSKNNDVMLQLLHNKLTDKQ